MANKPEVDKRITAVQFEITNSKYIPGQGAVTTSELIKMLVGFTDDEEPIYTDIFYVEWIDSYGSQAIMLQQQNVIRPARVRMIYNSELYNALKGKDVKIYLNCNKEECFVLNSSVSNYMQENHMLEFQVRRFEVK